MVNSQQLNADGSLGPVQSQQLTVNCQQLAVDGPPELMQMLTDGHIYIYIYIYISLGVQWLTVHLDQTVA